MLNIVLICNWGASTSMLAGKISEAAKEKGLECAVNAYSYEDVDGVLDAADIVLLGPQIAYKLKEFEKKYESRGVPFLVMNTMDYGRMNGGNVLQAVLEHLNKEK